MPRHLNQTNESIHEIQCLYASIQTANEMTSLKVIFIYLLENDPHLAYGDPPKKGGKVKHPFTLPCIGALNYLSLEREENARGHQFLKLLQRYL